MGEAAKSIFSKGLLRREIENERSRQKKREKYAAAARKYYADRYANDYEYREKRKAAAKKHYYRSK